jgi:hypothetical protein
LDRILSARASRNHGKETEKRRKTAPGRPYISSEKYSDVLLVELAVELAVHALSSMSAVTLSTPSPPPHWALLERELLAGISAGCVEFFEHYFDQKTGYGLWTPRWGGNDGPDDGAENGLNWTALHALGAPDEILQLWRKGWEGHLKQYTEAHTLAASLETAGAGMYYKEWNAQFDYFHHTEGMSAFTLQGLSEPYDPKVIERTKTYAAMYMGDDPEAPNYDKELKLCRSLFTGSRGPMLRKATGLDWAGDISHGP